MIHVLRPGLLSTIQDLGRTGLASLAVPRSGAADRDALRLGNRLVGNPEELAGIETTVLGADFRFDSACWVAVTGALCGVRVDGRPSHVDRPVFVPADGVLSLGAALDGVRSYLAVAGGIAVEPVLGSRSTDTLSGLGPPRLAVGDLLPLGTAFGVPAEVDWTPRSRAPAAVRLLLGPRDDWIDLTALGDYVVTSASDRVGVRLRGPALARTRTEEIPSEGMLPGAVQVPPDGQPVIMLADHPTTGGYPVVGVVHPADLGLVAQARPGAVLRFELSRRSRS
ncbi:biotin-dependent carboxyltransferase family protein [Hamadaea sp.]|uniref:5-oxoprolinase subunit C family protein n=1 Tax=Hamadaea sp. TaxID=2024425 RepID=UPI0025B8CE27|nr:biotin-dependent carboxyltransferase family protein [Hamadaea sp.]